MKAQPIGRVAETTKMHDIPVPKLEHRLSICSIANWDGTVSSDMVCICGWETPIPESEIFIDSTQPYENKHKAWVREQEAGHRLFLSMHEEMVPMEDLMISCVCGWKEMIREDNVFFDSMQPYMDRHIAFVRERKKTE